MIETLFPPEVVTLSATPEIWSGALLPEEEACLSPRAVEKRRREFTAGRVCARAALERLGIRGVPLRAGPDRAPVWPPGVVGSLSHCPDYCGVAVARRGAIAGLGFDAERLRPLGDRVVALICSEGERAHLASLPGLTPALWAMVVFCAKESAYKCQHPLTGMALGFKDVEILLDPRAGSFAATILGGHAPDGNRARPALRELRGRFARDGEHVFAGLTLTGTELAAASGAAAEHRP